MATNLKANNSEVIEQVENAKVSIDTKAIFIPVSPKWADGTQLVLPRQQAFSKTFTINGEEKSYPAVVLFNYEGKAFIVALKSLIGDHYGWSEKESSCSSKKSKKNPSLLVPAKLASVPYTDGELSVMSNKIDDDTQEVFIVKPCLIKVLDKESALHPEMDFSKKQIFVLNKTKVVLTPKRVYHFESLGEPSSRDLKVVDDRCIKTFE